MSVSANDDRIKQVLFQLGYKNQVTGIGATFLLPPIIAACYYPSLPRPALWWWLGIMWSIGALIALQRMYCSARLRHREADHVFIRKWRNFYFLQSTLIGFGWGNLGMLFVPGAFVQNAALMVIFLGIGATATNTAGTHHFPGMCAGASLGICLQLFYLPQGFGAHALPVQIILLLYLLVLIYMGRNINRLVLDSILLRYENEEILQQKIREAARADRANHDKSMFLAAASHDLRQPVHALLLLVTALHKRVRDTVLLDLVEHIQKAGQAIGTLFNALMELSRLESGAEKPEPEDIALSDLLSQAFAQQQPQASLKGLGLHLRLGKGLQQAHLRTDGLLLGRIINNLISNAIRYTPRGRILVTLRRRGPDMLWLEVRDTGIGIAADNLQKIFDPYFQVENRERDRSKGLGLGLAIVRKTVDLLGYRIEVHSRPERGTCFRIVLKGMWLARRAAMPRETASVHDLAGRRLLLIDDDPMVREATCIMLSSWHAEVRTAKDGDECLALLQEDAWAPECVLCDYRLPGSKNGIDLLNLLVDRYPGVAAVLQTGESNPELRDIAEDAGYIVLTKPIAADLLISTLSALLPERQKPAAA